MNRIRNISGFALVAVLALATTATAQQTRVFRDGNQWVEETTGTIPAATALKVSTHAGNVYVEGGNNTEIRYVVRKKARGSESAARATFNSLRLNVARNGETGFVSAVRTANVIRADVEFRLQVPRSLQWVKAETHGGNIVARNMEGKVWVNSLGGNLILDAIGGPVTAISSGGNVEVGSVGSDLTVKTGGGNVRVQAAKGRIITQSGGGNVQIGSGSAVAVNTGGGNVEVSECGGTLEAMTGGGSIDMGRVLGSASVRTSGGNIRFANARSAVNASSGGGSIELRGNLEGATVETGGGSIVVEFTGANFRGSNLETPAGDVIVYLTGDVRANVSAVIEDGSGHRIRSEMPDIVVRNSAGGFGSRRIVAEGQLNGGGAPLIVRTTRGDIEFRRKR